MINCIVYSQATVPVNQKLLWQPSMRNCKTCDVLNENSSVFRFMEASSVQHSGYLSRNGMKNK